MDKRSLIMTWKYDYNKESTWYDEDSGENQYDLTEGASYKLPYLGDKFLDVRSVFKEGDLVKAEIYVDHAAYTVSSGGEPTVCYAHDDYMVAGDSVSQTLYMELAIQ